MHRLHARQMALAQVKVGRGGWGLTYIPTPCPRSGAGDLGRMPCLSLLPVLARADCSPSNYNLNKEH